MHGCNSDSQRNSRTKGASMLEVMMVMLVVGILTAISLPFYNGSRFDSQMNATVGAITSLVAQTRSLLELVIAMAVFVTVSGAAFSIFGQNATGSSEQQSLSGVNIGLRNAMSQMEMDLSGAGGNLVAGVPNPPQFYFSVIINNNVPTVDGGTAAACTPNSSWGYPTSSACFDSITALSPNDSLVKKCTTAGGTTAPVLDIKGTGPNLSAATIVTADDPNNSGVTATWTADATCFQQGDEILFAMLGNSGGGE